MELEKKFWQYISKAKEYEVINQSYYLTGSGKSIFSGFGFCLIHSRTRVTLELVSCRQEGIDLESTQLLNINQILLHIDDKQKRDVTY